MSRGEGNVPSRWEPFSSAESAQAQVSGQQRREGGGLTLPNGTLDIFKSGKSGQKRNCGGRGRGWESCVLGCHIIVTILKTK